MSEVNKNLGHATAYGYAKSKGYTGTEEQFAELMASYADVAEDAAQSASEAAQSATAAAASATNAASNASGATQSAQSASASATSASQSATAATSAVSTAQTAAQTATTKASEASQSATNAASSATTANSAADDATAAKTAAETAKTAAQQSATSAATSAQTAQDVLESIPEDYSQMSDDLSAVKSALYDSSKGIQGIGTQSAFEVGAIKSTDSWATLQIDTSKKYRVSTIVDFTFEHDTFVKIASGFKAVTLTWSDSDNKYIDSGWQMGHLFIPANKNVCLSIARITEVTSEIADIEEFVSKVTFETFTQKTVQDKLANEGCYVFDKWILGNWSNTGGGQEPTPSAYVNNRARMPYGLLMPKGSKLVITANGDGYFAAFYSADGLWTSKTGLTTRYVDSVTEFDEDTYVYIVCRNTAGNAIDMNNLKVVATIYSTLAYINSDRITALESSVNGSISSYYQAEMDTTIESVRSCLTEPCLIMPLITDIHRWQSTEEPQLFLKSIQNINYFKERVKCDGILNLGDNTEGNLAPSATIARSELMLESFMSLGLPYYQCIGNHDDNRYGTEHLTLAEMYRAYMSPTKDAVFDSNMVGTNFYKDFDDVEIRMICVNSNDNGTYAYTEDTYNFITSALNTDKTVVFCSHISPIYSQNFQGTDPTNGNAIQNAINSFITDGGKLIQLCGHSHADYSFTSPYLSIFSDCNLFENFSVDTRWPSGAIHNARTQGTATEDCWSVLVVRPTARKVNLIRFGAGSDREFTF